MAAGSTPDLRIDLGVAATNQGNSDFEGSSTLARRFQTLEQQRQQRVDPRRGTRLFPFIGVSWMVEAAGGVENGAGRNLDVGDLERALLQTVGQDQRDLVDQAILVAVHGL